MKANTIGELKKIISKYEDDTRIVTSLGADATIIVDECGNGISLTESVN